jgi:hypothetical protein
MASYKVVFKPSVEKDLRALPQSVVGRVFKRSKHSLLNHFRVSRPSWLARNICIASALAITALFIAWTRTLST